MGRFSSRSTTVRMEGAAGVGMLIGPGPGDFSHGETNSENAERIRAMDRNRFDCLVIGDDLEQDFSVTVHLRNESTTSATLQRALDFVMRTGVFASGGITPVQSVDLNPDAWAWVTIITMLLGATTATFRLPHCNGGYAFSEAKETNSVTITGRNNGVIVRT